MRELFIIYVILSTLVIIVLSVLYGRCRGSENYSKSLSKGSMSNKICAAAKSCGPCPPQRICETDQDCYNRCMMSPTGAAGNCESQCTSCQDVFNCPDVMPCCAEKCRHIGSDYGITLSNADCVSMCKNKYYEMSEGGKCSY